MMKIYEPKKLSLWDFEEGETYIGSNGKKYLLEGNRVFEFVSDDDSGIMISFIEDFKKIKKAKYLTFVNIKDRKLKLVEEEMNIRELKEGKRYESQSPYDDGIFKIEDGELLILDGERTMWKIFRSSYKKINEMTFIEIPDEKRYWKAKFNDEIIVLDSDFGIETKIKDTILVHKFNEFHPCNMEEARCLGLETRIKARILNWRRIHDTNPLDLMSTSDYKYAIEYNVEKDKVEIIGHFAYIEAGLGYFSSEERAKTFYNNNKELVDEYFKERIENKF